MSISGALSNALSGLTASSRAAEVVASNISNATTEGYAPRDLELAARVLGGVSVTGIIRHVDPALTADRRLADASHAEAETRGAYLSRVADMAGMPGAPGALGTLLSEFDAALVTAASQPNVTARLDVAVIRADAVVEKLTTMSDGLQAMRQEADRGVAEAVSRLNTLLTDLEGINTRLVGARGQEGAALQDQRDRMIDEISTIVPVRVVPRDNNGLALYTSHGAVLFEGQAARIGFTPTPTFMPHMTAGSGLLSGLTINGNPLATDPPGGALRGGTLGALFAMRDGALVDAQVQLDGVARDLAERFQGMAVDPTLGAGDAGLFTDAGAAVLATNEVGLAGRLQLNPAVDPVAGGESWRMRDGLATTAPGASGNGALLTAMSAALGDTRVPGSAALPAVSQSLHSRVADYQSNAAVLRNEAERRQGFVTAQRDALRVAEKEGGVDSDAELQKLMLIEQSYAANARVIETVGKLIDTLMRI